MDWVTSNRLKFALLLTICLFIIVIYYHHLDFLAVRYYILNATTAHIHDNLCHEDFSLG